MAFRIPNTLKAFNLYLEGNNFAGLAAKLKLPEIKTKKEEHRGAGMDMPRSLMQGIEALECEFTLTEFSADVRAKVGIQNGHNTELVFKGSIGDDSGAGATKPVLVTIRGAIMEDTPSEWESGKKTEDSYKVECKFYELKVDGKEVYYIDQDNMIRRIEGTDYLASQRSDIGF